jgi:hypothetical protein
MRSRCAILAVLVLGCLTGVTACGDDDSATGTGSASGTTTSAAAGGGATRPAGAGADKTSDDYEGVFATTREVCSIPSRKRLAQNAHSKSTRPEAIARAMAAGYKPQLRTEAYRGCLAGLRNPSRP